nr:RNA-binding protein [Grapevine virus N]
MSCLGESKSASKRRAKRYGVCYSCGRSVCKCDRNKTSPFDLRDMRMYEAVRKPATRYLTESRGSYLHNASQKALDELERLNISGYDKYVKFNKAPAGCKSPEETPEFYSF